MSHKARLKQVDSHIRGKREQFRLMPLTIDQDLELQRALPFAFYRMVSYLVRNPGSRTDYIARDCAIINVPDQPSKYRPRLNAIGLDVVCDVQPAINRYGSATTIGYWFLVVLDENQWSYASGSAANDDSFYVGRAS